MKTAMEEPSAENAKRWAEAEKEWHLKFLRSPKEFIPDKSGKRVDGVRLAVNKLEVTNNTKWFLAKLHTLTVNKIQLVHLH